MLFRVQAKPVLDGPGDGVVVPLAHGRETLGRRLGLACQERQEMVSPLLTWPPGDLSHALEGFQERLSVVALPHLLDVDMGYGYSCSVPVSASDGGDEFTKDSPICRQRPGYLQQHPILDLMQLALQL
jgi:hypothetical protein